VRKGERLGERVQAGRPDLLGIDVPRSARIDQRVEPQCLHVLLRICCRESLPLLAVRMSLVLAPIGRRLHDNSYDKSRESENWQDAGATGQEGLLR